MHVINTLSRLVAYLDPHLTWIQASFETLDVLHQRNPTQFHELATFQPRGALNHASEQLVASEVDACSSNYYRCRYKLNVFLFMDFQFFLPSTKVKVRTVFQSWLDAPHFHVYQKVAHPNTVLLRYMLGTIYQKFPSIYHCCRAKIYFQELPLVHDTILY